MGQVPLSVLFLAGSGGSIGANPAAGFGAQGGVYVF